jgi:hypothetical protein
MLSLTEQSIKLQLKETDSLLNYAANIIFSDMKKEKLFSHCEDIEEVKEALDKVISEGKMILQANKNNTYKLTLFGEFLGKCFSVDITLNEEEMPNNENILHRIDGSLKTLPTLMDVEDMLKQYYNALTESIKINNKELSHFKEEIKSQFIEHSESRLKANEENIFKAIDKFDNYKLQIDSIDSFDSLTNKMSLYKDVLMNLEDDKISNLLKERFCCLYNIMSNEFRMHYKIMKETLTEHKTKDDHLSQIIKELKDEIMRQSSKEDNIIQTIKELNEEILKQNAKGDNNVS